MVRVTQENDDDTSSFNSEEDNEGGIESNMRISRQVLGDATNRQAAVPVVALEKRTQSALLQHTSRHSPAAGSSTDRSLCGTKLKSTDAPPYRRVRQRKSDPKEEIAGLLTQLVNRNNTMPDVLGIIGDKYLNGLSAEHSIRVKTHFAGNATMALVFKACGEVERQVMVADALRQLGIAQPVPAVPIPAAAAAAVLEPVL